MKYLLLSRGQKTILDDEDYEKVKMWRWTAALRDGKFYAQRGISRSNVQTTIYLSRLVCSAPRGKEVDHINGNSLDNRRCNLRICAHWQNSMNRQPNKKHRGKKCLSRFKGVSKLSHSNRWYARIVARGRAKYLGSFDTQKEAAVAYDTASAKLHGLFSSPNLA